MAGKHRALFPVDPGRSTVLTRSDQLTVAELGTLTHILRNALGDMTTRNIPSEGTWLEVLRLHTEVRALFLVRFFDV